MEWPSAGRRNLPMYSGQTLKCEINIEYMAEGFINNANIYHFCHSVFG